MTGVYVAISSLSFAILITLARRVITRFASPWIRAGLIVGVLYALLRLMFAAAAWLSLQGREGWILIFGSLGVAAIEAILWRRVRRGKRALVEVLSASDPEITPIP